MSQPPTTPQGLLKNLMEQPDEDIDLAKAALYISAEEYPAVDVDHYLNVLDTLAEEAGKYVALEQGHEAAVQTLSDFLFVQRGFVGNQEDYYDPRNSYLNQVLDRKMGIPITLCLVYMEVAKRMGMMLEGIGLPGHFVVRTGPPEGELYADVFNGGRLMSKVECKDLVLGMFQGRLEFKEEYLLPYTKRQFLVRMLTNLKHVYLNSQDYRRSIVVADLIDIVEPGLGNNLKERAMIRLRLNQYRMAIQDLEAYLSAYPEANDVDEIKRQIKEIWETLSSLN